MVDGEALLSVHGADRPHLRRRQVSIDAREA
jgi:hypothetical protein